MDQRIENMKSTTFFGKRFTRKQIIEIQQMATVFTSLSRWELGQTVCENYNWVKPDGGYRIRACLQMLEFLEGLGIFIITP